MRVAAHRAEAPSAICVDLGAIFVSLELSSIKVVDHFAVAGRWREDVEAYGCWR